MINFSVGAEVFRGNKEFGVVYKVFDEYTIIIKMKPGRGYKEEEKLTLISSHDKLELNVLLSKTEVPFMLRAIVLHTDSVLHPRKHKRFNLTLIVNVDKIENTATTIDISEGGMKFILKNPIVQGKMIQLKFKLGGSIFDVKGQVVGVKRVKDGFRYNIQFVNLEEKNGEILKKLLSEVG